METLAPFNKQILESSTWYHAVTLMERIASLRSSKEDSAFTPVAPYELATQQLQQWKRLAPFRDEVTFAGRLALDALTEQELLAILAEPIERAQARLSWSSPPPWVRDLFSAFEDQSASEESFLSPVQQENRQDTVSLAEVLKPLLKIGIDEICQGIQELTQKFHPLPFDPGTIIDLLLVNLTPRLQRTIMRPLVLEMHIARLEQRLQGNSPEERFENFLRQLRQKNELLSFLHEYPVLARHLITMIRLWANFSLEFLRHLCADWAEICATLAEGIDPGILVEVEGGVGDTHRNGRSVALLRFSTGFRLVYKPRSLSLDLHFQELLTWVNEYSISLPLRTVKMLDKQTHGWSEFVLAHGCTTEEEIAHFYERQGSYLALLYVLDATDLHFENLLAAGEHPVLVDLEALFHPHVEQHNMTAPGSLASQSVGYSALRTGLLPQRTHQGKDDEGIDVSGLGGREGQLTPRPVPLWKNMGTDQMHLIRERLEIAGSKNRPTLNGNVVEILKYENCIITGFTRMYNLLVKHRNELLTHILPRFACDEVRLILRHTSAYTTLLYESLHPDRLRNALDRDRFFDSLWEGVHLQPYLSRVITAERKDLLQGDIPLFTARPGSTDIFTSTGECITEFCVEPSIEFVKRRIQQMGTDDLSRQQWIIKASLMTMLMDVNQLRRIPLKTQPIAPVTHGQLIKAACAVGDRLYDLALRSEYGTNWIGVSLLSEGKGKIEWQLQAADLTLYDGAPGIILFLSYLGALTGKTKYTDLAKSAVLTVRDQIEKQRSARNPLKIGTFIGLGAPIYLFSHLGALWADNTYYREAEEIVARLDVHIENDEHPDIIVGSAGCIASLLSLYQVAPSERTLAAAIRCGTRLLAQAQPMTEGVGWYTLSPDVPLAGFSHGAAGIALSLLRLAAVSKQTAFRQTAMAALAYERSLFSSEKQNWPEAYTLMEGDALPEHMRVAWCHGAAGVGLSRLASLNYLDDTTIRDEIKIAIDTTLTAGFGQNHSLCHGDLGNLDLLLTATQILDDPEHRRQLERLTALVLDSIDTYGWVTGVPLGVETPGLMTGLAGIGYELLRLAEPERVPSVLLVAPPLSHTTLKA